MVVEKKKTRITKRSFDAFLKFIRENDHQAAAVALQDKPELAQAVYSGSSKKYDSQTLLMIAVKYDAPEIVHIRSARGS